MQYFLVPNTWLSNIAGNLIKRSKRGAELNKVMRIYVTCEGRKGEGRVKQVMTVTMLDMGCLKHVEQKGGETK